MLLDIARILSGIPEMAATIEIYAANVSTEIAEELVQQKNIKLCKPVTVSEIKNIIINAAGLLHVESFEQRFIDYTIFSVSTKLPEYFASGTAIFAYGPEEVASIKYLAANHCAAIAGTVDQALLRNSLKEFMNDAALRSKVAANAMKLCRQNHEAANQRQRFLETLLAAARNRKIDKQTGKYNGQEHFTG